MGLISSFQFENYKFGLAGFIFRHSHLFKQHFFKIYNFIMFKYCAYERKNWNKKKKKGNRRSRD